MSEVQGSPVQSDAQAGLFEHDQRSLEHLLMSRRRDELPQRLAEVEKAIATSRYILDLEENWDDEGASRYSPVTWQRATEFLKKQAVTTWEVHGTMIPVPRILPGPDGHIDLHWKTDAFELLISIPPREGDPASFYGDDYGKLSIEGTLRPETINNGLLSWLSKN